MTVATLEHGAVAQWRVTLALAGRALRIQLRRIQFLMPSFVLPLLLLVVIASGTSAAQELPGFPVKSSYVGFVVSGTIIQGALLVGLMAGIAVADEIEGGFFDRLLSAPIHRASIVAGRVLGTMLVGVAQAVLFLCVALAFGADFTGGPAGFAAVMALAAISAGAAAGLGATIALRTGSLSLLQNLFPFVFILLFTAPAFQPGDFVSPALQA
ncbi:MAG: ABC transporter permease, partial [Solirubrobacterales bacterium]